MNIPFRHILLASMISSVMVASAITPEEVTKAVNLAREAPKNKVLNRKAGEALQEAGRYKEAVSFYLKGDNAANLGAAECYFYLYDFDKAEEHLDKYLAKRTKAEEAKDQNFSYGDGSEMIDWTENLSNRIELGRSMLDRVEQIEIVDSINVPAEQFFKFVKLAKSAGALMDDSVLDKAVNATAMEQLGVNGLCSPVYVSESGDDIIWYGSTGTGNSKVFESIRLADGSWDNPTELFDYASIFGDSNGSWVAYPFLMSDGITLYFAADGENSLGELDIFISRRESDGFLQPSNIGMPYNSPYNDYLYAIDEENGIGWWVSDRNQLQDSVTIYTFLPKDLRVNYPVETPDLADYARVSSIAMTQKGETDYAQIRKQIAAISSNTGKKNEDEIRFALPGGRIITSTSQLRSPRAATALREYFAAEAKVEKMRQDLAAMRTTYAKRDKSIGPRILAAEKELEQKEAELKQLKNRVISLEKN